MESLANKYRPKCFAEVIGQQTIISILSKQIETKTFKQAYLFCGPTGCGKTTCARLFHKGVNNGAGEPKDINAADNNGIGLVRDLAVDAQQTALDCDVKTYIVDECHQFTRAAWDAALKLIEEPPSNVVFIFCTTNPNKVPETIMTRVQRFDFKRVPANIIADRLEFIMNEEFPTIKYERDALLRIAAKANGFVREAITLLDLCINTGEVNTTNVCNTLGVIKYEVLWNYTKAILNKDSTKAFEYVQKMLETKSDTVALLDEILEFFIECTKIMLTKEPAYSKISKDYADEILQTDFDFMEFVDRAFKYAQLRTISTGDTLVNILTSELCRR